MKVAGVVVLYNSPVSCVENIDTYLVQLSKLFVVDNSDCVNETLVEQINKLTNVQYIYNFGNKGIANALNRAAEYAIMEGNDYLLTMDDDSSVPDNMILEMKHFISGYSDPNQIGIVSVAHSPATLRVKKPNPVLYTMTCGNIINLKAHKVIGGFREDLFVDHVDHEYCLHLSSAGYTIIELPISLNSHVLGERKHKWGMPFVSRQPVRQYYMVRNGIITAHSYFNKYPIFTYKIAKLLVKEFLKIVFAQGNKKQRMWLMVRGIQDALLGKIGKI
ncbi:glycosyltransferase [Spirosoma oryzicola]|uniref:glycosyltransferase n=1 Tax=Spirosoma oryzicola TaxID=2898794 RepID=UPI001E531611|nr:glycosyltransferase [Spirosoma oryzicola]UHG94867.1 glycosyltransferase [Spirosoma oryzicola]